MYRYMLYFIIISIICIIPYEAICQKTKKNISDISIDALLETKITTASKHDQTSSEAPGSIIIITSDDIALSGYRTLEGAIMKVRGIYTRNDRNY